MSERLNDFRILRSDRILNKDKQRYSSLFLYRAVKRYSFHKIKRWRATVPCSELVDCSGWLQGWRALEVAQLWAWWDCGEQSLPLWAPLGSEQKSGRMINNLIISCAYQPQSQLPLKRKGHFLLFMLAYPWYQTLTILANVLCQGSECGAALFMCRLVSVLVVVPVTKHAGGKHWALFLTQPVALNILRSKGSPESSPSILVSEWQVAMQATNAEFTRLSLAASDSGGEKLQQRGRIWLSSCTVSDYDRRNYTKYNVV